MRPLSRALESSQRPRGRRLFSFRRPRFAYFWSHCIIYLRKSQIKMQPPRDRIPVFSLRIDRTMHFSGFSSKFCKKILFFAQAAENFSTGKPDATNLSRQSCGKLCGNCEKPLSPCGFPFSPVSTTGVFYVNSPCFFSAIEQKTPFFGRRNPHKIGE